MNNNSQLRNSNKNKKMTIKLDCLYVTYWRTYIVSSAIVITTNRVIPWKQRQKKIEFDFLLHHNFNSFPFALISHHRTNYARDFTWKNYHRVGFGILNFKLDSNHSMGDCLGWPTMRSNTRVFVVWIEVGVDVKKDKSKMIKLILEMCLEK